MPLLWIRTWVISITKSISKIFIPNFVWVLANERYKTYQTRFLFCRLGHALGVGPGVLKGQNQISSCCLSVMLSPPKPLDEIQPNLVCELLLWMGRATAIFLPRPLGRGQISFNFNYKVNFKDFYTKLCVCSNKWKIQNISDGIFILLPGPCPRGGTKGHWGCPGSQKIQTWSCAYQIDGVDEQNRVQVGSNWWHWGEVKRSNIINMSISKILYQTLCVFSQIKDRKHI